VHLGGRLRLSLIKLPQTIHDRPATDDQPDRSLPG